MTDESNLHRFLQGLRRTINAVALYPLEHPLIQESLAAMAGAIDLAVPESGELILTIRDEGLYQDGHLLPYASLEFSGFVRELQARDISSLTFRHPVADSDLLELAAFVSQKSGDLPAGGTILLNEDHLTASDDGLSPLRRSYAGSLEALRRSSDWLAHEGAFDLNPVMTAVEDLVDRSLAETKAALLLSTVKSHDEYTFYHSVNSSILTLALGKILGLTAAELVPIGTGALLHDIGKVTLSKKILNHPGRLDADGWREVQRHPQEGAQAILSAAGQGHEISATIALEHHARFDGTGYPSDRRQPHVVSSLVSLVDVYDALTARRRYRRAETPNRALEHLLAGMGTAFHPDLVRAFIKLMGVYPPGSILRLEDGTVVVVTTPGGDPGKATGVLVVTAEGERIAPEPITFPTDDVSMQLLPDRVGIDPSALLEADGVEDQLQTEPIEALD